MAKKTDLETLRSNYLASRKAYEEAENERINNFAKLLFSDEDLKQKVLEMKSSALKETAKLWADCLKDLS
jgi:hypothetical protein